MLDQVEGGVKGIVFDLDGTLIGDEFALSPRVRQAVARAHAAGVTVTLASGRGYPSMRGFARQLGVDAPLIAYQGAQTWTAEGVLLEETPLSRAHLPRAITTPKRALPNPSLPSEMRWW